MSDIHIKPELLRVLKELKLKQFTVAELTEAYLSAPHSPHESKKAARQFVYRNIVRMIKSGLMEKQVYGDSWPRYSITPAFQENEGLLREEPIVPTILPPASTPPAPANMSLPVQTLKERLSKHRSDMLCAMGEVEEYNALCEELPELRMKTQSLYNQARERSAMLLGKIKALESLLDQMVSQR
jgi:hypothetical protein